MSAGGVLAILIFWGLCALALAVIAGINRRKSEHRDLRISEGEKFLLAKGFEAFLVRETAEEVRYRLDWDDLGEGRAANLPTSKHVPLEFFVRSVADRTESLELLYEAAVESAGARAEATKQAGVLRSQEALRRANEKRRQDAARKRLAIRS